MDLDEFFDDRESRTAQKVDEFATSFQQHLQEDGAKVLGESGCVYVVGSAGRGEMSASSDLDLFLVTHAVPKRVHEVLAQAAVLRMMSEHGLPEPSNDALFLRLYAAQDLERRLGEVQDDSENTFTARMLLLLESRVLYGPTAYDQLIEHVLNAYWRNNERHTEDYLPLVLVNDIVRYWRVVLLNYEAKFERKRLKLEDSEEAKRSLEQEKLFASYKLRFSRCMTCYSMIARLLAETTQALGHRPHVSRDSMRRIVRSTPVQRIRQIRALAVSQNDQTTVEIVDELLLLYRGYLEVRERSDAEAKALFGAPDSRREHFAQAGQFGERMFALLQRLGSSSPLYRYVVA